MTNKTRQVGGVTWVEIAAGLAVSIGVVYIALLLGAFQIRELGLLVVVIAAIIGMTLLKWLPWVERAGRALRRRWKPVENQWKVRYARNLLSGLPQFDSLPDAKKWRIVREINRVLSKQSDSKPAFLIVGFGLVAQVVCLSSFFFVKDPITARLNQDPSTRPWAEVVGVASSVLVFCVIVPLALWIGWRLEAVLWRSRVKALQGRTISPRCGGCQYPLAGIPLVNNAVTCPECGDLNRFWPGSKPHRAMLEAMGQPPLPTTTDPGPADEARRASDRS